MRPSEHPPTWATSVLLVDGNDTERAFYAEGLKRCAPDYQILEVADGQSGLHLYRRSHEIDCVVLELALPDMSGFRLLSDFILIPSRPTVAVVVLTHLGYKGLWELAKEHGAYAWLLKQHTEICFHAAYSAARSFAPGPENTATQTSPSPSGSIASTTQSPLWREAFISYCIPSLLLCYPVKDKERH